jgi:energy-converting hydrogenase Eha subunit A
MSSSRPARAAISLGVLALAALPIGSAVSTRVKGIGLLEAMEFAVPIAFVLGLAAVAAARRARFSLERSVHRPGAGVVRVARFVAWFGLYIACTGGIALGFYGLLVLRGG